MLAPGDFLTLPSPEEPEPGRPQPDPARFYQPPTESTGPTQEPQPTILEALRQMLASINT